MTKLYVDATPAEKLAELTAGYACMSGMGDWQIAAQEIYEALETTGHLNAETVETYEKMLLEVGGGIPKTIEVY